MKWIFCLVLVVCMIGVMIPSVYATEIPDWIKNNAGWWADGQIDDASFLNGIEYLTDNLIIQISPNQKVTPGSGLLLLDRFAYELPKRSQTTDVSISGVFENWSGGSVNIEITKPNGKIDNISARSTGDFQYTYHIKSDFPLGQYQISATIPKGIQLGLVSFKLNAQSDISEKSVPAWVKNAAGWWAADVISDTEFVNAFEYLVKEDVIRVNVSQTSETSQSVPDWVKNTAGWWAENVISETEFVNAISYLIKVGIINIESSKSPELIAQMWVDGQMDDDEFLRNVDYLVESGIITAQTDFMASMSDLPDWLVNNAGWWTAKIITNSDFVDKF